MNKKDQVIAIAEACGWTNFDCRKVNESLVIWGAPPNAKYTTLVPNFTKDLNAMHEARKLCIRNSEQIQEYFYQLNDAVGLVNTTSPAWIKEFATYALIDASAAEHAEAFLKTLDLWKNE
jgi:hypothetical protein